MSQADSQIGADKSGLDYRTEDNAGKKALLNHHKGNTAPGYAEAGMIWIDDTATPWVMKIYDGTDWITMGSVNATSNLFAADSTSLLASANEYTKTQNFNATTLTDAANIAWDVQDNQVASVTLGGNRTLDNPSNLVDGATYLLIVKQDGTGSRTLGYGSVYKFPDGTAPTLTTTANAVDILSFVSDGTNMYGVFQGDFS